MAEMYVTTGKDGTSIERMAEMYVTTGKAVK